MKKNRLYAILKRKLIIPVIIIQSINLSGQQSREKMEYLQYIREHVPSSKEIDVFLTSKSWAQFDPELGYILGNYMPHDGYENSSTISTVQTNGARTSFIYSGRPCRINTYGNSFTQCHQVNDGETWQEYLAAHLGEPIHNFGMGGYGFYQSYRRMLREESTENKADYIILYIWGDDHIRSMFRCRYMAIPKGTVKQPDDEDEGIMFHGNFWSNIEMDFSTEKLVEHKSRICSREELYKMTNPDWMVENLKDDLALQMFLFKQGLTSTVDMQKVRQLRTILNCQVSLDDNDRLRESISELLDKYSFTVTKYILNSAKEFAEKNSKKLMIVLFDPYSVTRTLINSGSRYDQEIVDFLQDNGFDFFDMNLVHVEDYKNFNLSVDQYFSRYFIGHYNPAGNHFFAFAICPKVVNWLDPKPIIYKDKYQKMIDFDEYLMY
jgi:hypothetical protein